MYKGSCCVHLSAGSNRFRKLMNRAKNAFNKAAKHVHDTNQFAYEDKPVKELHKAINAALQDAVQTGITHEIPTPMLNKLRQDVFVFSGMKTYAELKELSGLLVDANGTFRQWPEFLKEAERLNLVHNENYLQAEHQQAIATSQALDQYLEYEKDGDAYDLQIRTAQDDRVRDSHAALHGITLPFGHPFWETHWTPFGWRCRCNIVQVRKGKYPHTDTDTVNKLGESAVSEMFRYNPAKQGVIFPPKHPYYAQHCGKKLRLKGNINSIFITLQNEKDKCQWQTKLKADAIVSQKVKEFPSGGSIHRSPLVDQLAGDYKKVLKCCDHFARNGHQAEILPKIHKDDPAYQNFFGDLIGTKYEGKCPDFRIDGIYYELEGFTTKNPQKNALGNMLSRGQNQSSRIVIEDEGSTINHIKRIAYLRKKDGQIIDEIWRIKKDGRLEQVY